MPQTYQGQNVKSVRDAQQGDQGFQQGQDQVVITLDNNQTKTVKRSELQNR